jgi:hypothetical protein
MPPPRLRCRLVGTGMNVQFLSQHSWKQVFFYIKCDGVRLPEAGTMFLEDDPVVSF